MEYQQQTHNKKTFSNQIFLPPLPLHPPQKTLEKYLKSLIPLLSKEDYEYSCSVVNQFLTSGDAERLHSKLELR